MTSKHLTSTRTVRLGWGGVSWGGVEEGLGVQACREPKECHQQGHAGAWGSCPGSQSSLGIPACLILGGVVAERRALG